MPVTGLDDDWLQSQLMANYGASAPYGPSGYPDNLPNRPYSPPGGGLVGYPGATPGAPSMGYPAMPGPAQGLSLTNNPIVNWLRNNGHLASSAFANMPGPPAIGFGGAAGTAITPAGPTTSPPAGRRTDAAYGPYDDPNAPDPVGDYVSRVGNYPSWPTPPAPTQSPVSVATGPRGVKRTDAAYGPYNAPGAGAPQGSPSQTPRPPSKSSSRFGTVQYQVPGTPGPLSRAPIYTTLNLFGRG